MSQDPEGSNQHLTADAQAEVSATSAHVKWLEAFRSHTFPLAQSLSSSLFAKDSSDPRPHQGGLLQVFDTKKVSDESPEVNVMQMEIDPYQTQFMHLPKCL